MKQAIAICSTPTYSPWLNNLLESFDGYSNYLRLIIQNYGWELGKIAFMRDHTDFDEFFLLHETTEIKDPKMFDIIFDEHAGESVIFGSPYNSYLMKYRREVLEGMEIPAVHNKKEAVYYEEWWNREYAKKEGSNNIWTFDHFFRDGGESGDDRRTINKFGRDNLIIENDFLIKYKGTWDIYQLEEQHQQGVFSR